MLAGRWLRSAGFNDEFGRGRAGWGGCSGSGMMSGREAGEGMGARGVRVGMVAPGAARGCWSRIVRSGEMWFNVSDRQRCWAGATVAVRWLSVVALASFGIDRGGSDECVVTDLKAAGTQVANTLGLRMVSSVAEAATAASTTSTTTAEYGEPGDLLERLSDAAGDGDEESGSDAADGSERLYPAAGGREQPAATDPDQPGSLAGHGTTRRTTKTSPV